MRAVDLFAGAGGLTTGAVAAGVRVLWAANHWRAAVDVHAANHPGIEHSCQDLHQADWSRVPRHDLLLAAPSCQGHSKSRGKERPHHDAARSTAWAVVSCVLALTLACGGDHDAGDAGDGSDVETATADGESTSDDDASTGDDESLPPGVKPCVVDLDCGPAGSSCAYPNGCDASGQCVPEKALGECAQNPAPLVPEPDGRRCAPEGSGLDPCPEGAECFYWDGQCGAGKWGVCRANITICELLPPEMFEADSWCEPPMLLPNGKITCESPRY